VIAGAAAFPALGELVAAAPGEGCWWNGVRCSVSRVDDIAAATVVTTDEHFRFAPQYRPAWEALAARSAMSRSWGDCYGYLLVATGRAEVMVDGIVAAWDTTAFLPIIEEAGGVFTDWTGRREPQSGTAVATNAALADVVRTVLEVRP
jgi:fructose-1,6-bisphosphatase/inositol monophosphatase family enzyme